MTPLELVTLTLASIWVSLFFYVRYRKANRTIPYSRLLGSAFKFTVDGVEYTYFVESDQAKVLFHIRGHTVKVVESALFVVSVYVNRNEVSKQHKLQILERLKPAMQYLDDLFKQERQKKVEEKQKQADDLQKAIDQVTFKEIVECKDKGDLAPFLVSPDPLEREVAKSQYKQLDQDSTNQSTRHIDQ